MRLMIGLLVAGMAVATLSGCRRAAPAPAPRPEPPPLKLSFRKSQIPTESMVAGINNPSSSESIKVIAVFVKGKDEKEERLIASIARSNRWTRFPSAGLS
jgi:hypothetical protein